MLPPKLLLTDAQSTVLLPTLKKAKAMPRWLLCVVIIINILNAINQMKNMCWRSHKSNLMLISILLVIAHIKITIFSNKENSYTHHIGI